MAKTPHLIAAVFQEESLTYEELNAKANQLAYYIRNQYKQKTKKRLKPDVLIALCLDRSLDILIGILAVLKAGGAYVPIDPKYPAERIQFILTDTNAALLLTQFHLKKSLEKIASKPAPQMIAIDTRPYINEGNINLPTYSAPNHLAYVIYTSGTTGNPKGVMLEQHSLVALITQYTHACPYPNLDNPRVLSLTNYTFDISGLEFYLPLLNGGVTVLAQIDNLEASIINTHRINVIQQTPSVWKQILEMIPPEQLQGIICLMGGEVVDQATLQKMQANASEVINGYGSSETTIYRTRYVYGKESGTPAVIGKPLPNEKVYVLDGKLNPVPIGVIGELYIRGEKLARGYLNRPKLTKERFIRNPFTSKSDRSKKYTRLYKTGDLVRWLPDGNLEYRGRNDFQVKIHGYRIELGEVEHALMKIPGIRNGVVLAKTQHPGDPTSHYLAAYYVSKYPLDVNYLRSELSKHVPQYMIPTAFVHMPSLPLSPSGKLNRKALPDPDFHKHTEAYVAPRNEIETQLAQLWQEVLDIKRIGINDNFFKIGGDSIKAIQLIHKANQLGIHLQTGNLFQQPTIANLAKSVTPSAAPKIHPVSSEKSEYPASSSQLRFYAATQKTIGNLNYNAPFLIEIKGHLDIPRLEAAFKMLANRHESFRTSFRMRNGKLMQHIDKQISIEVEKIKNKISDSAINQFIKPFQLDQAPLFKVHLVETEVDHYLLIVNAHHTIVDVLSLILMTKEIAQLYADAPLAPLELHYKDFSQWQRQKLKAGGYAETEKYWMKHLKDVPLLELPTDFPRPPVQSFIGKRTTFFIEKSTVQLIHAFIEDRGVTAYSFLLSIFLIILNKFTHQNDILLGTPYTERISYQFNQFIGPFLNIVAMRNYVSIQKNYSEFLSEVNSTFLRNFSHSEYPIMNLVEKLKIQDPPDRSHFIDVVFNFINVQVPKVNLFGCETQWHYIDLDVAKRDLSLEIQEESGEMKLVFEYPTALFKPETMEILAKQFKETILWTLKNPELKLEKIPFDESSF
ncbi:amino acid adenylation domain-containing protein [Coxiella burnetii]|uniref:amino acid adenylation domain-containing protein n=1 Tax=Coxiella burnetii TaxID=777 RepID=UPI002230982C|nr:amino acid adenylation domain-containing protein [Coxiella burnetii]